MSFAHSNYFNTSKPNNDWSLCNFFPYNNLHLYLKPFQGNVIVLSKAFKRAKHQLQQNGLLLTQA